MSEPECAHQWQVARDHSGKRMQVCRLCGKAEESPDRRLIFTAEKPVLPGWYWYRLNHTDTHPVVVQVHPESDTVGPWGNGTTSSLSTQQGEFAGPLEVPQ
jgi:hypothetical protein